MGATEVAVVDDDDNDDDEEENDDGDGTTGGRNKPALAPADAFAEIDGGGAVLLIRLDTRADGEDDEDEDEDEEENGTDTAEADVAGTEKVEADLVFCGGGGGSGTRLPPAALVDADGGGCAISGGCFVPAVAVPTAVAEIDTAMAEFECVVVLALALALALLPALVPASEPALGRAAISCR